MYLFEMLNSIKLAWKSSFKISMLRQSLYKCLFLQYNAKPIFIFGCQRSGTTIVQELISLDSRVKMYGEGELPYFNNSHYNYYNRLNTSNKIVHLLSRETAPYVSIKPLYESYRARELIDTFNNSRGIWIFRYYKHVISSHIKYYNHDVRKYLKPLFKVEPESWLNEFIAPEIRSFINEFTLEKISKEDAYALLWIARNSLYNEVIDHSKILLINYEKLVNVPDEQIEKLFNFFELPYKTYYSSLIQKKIY